MPTLIEPEGADEPLPETQADAAEVETSEATEARREWDLFFIGLVGLLSAKAVDLETPADAFPTVANITWEWRQVDKVYRNVETERVLRAARVVRLREQLIAKHLPHVDRLAVDLRTGKITIQNYRQQMQQRIKRHYIQQWSLGKGGVNAMTENDLLQMQGQLESQYRFLDNFTEQIRRGELSFRQVRYRSEMYMHSGTQAFERGKGASYGLNLPEYPADGNQICRANCKCHWEFETEDGLPVAYWIIDSAAEHCRSCVENRARYNPFRG